MTIEPRVPSMIEPIIVATAVECSDPNNWYVVVDGSRSGDSITSIVASNYSEPPSGSTASPPTNTDPITIFPDGYSIENPENTQGEPTPYRFAVIGTLVRWEETSTNVYRYYIRFPMQGSGGSHTGGAGDVGLAIYITYDLNGSDSVTETTINYCYLGYPAAPSIINSSISLTTGSNTTKITGVSGTLQPNRSGDGAGSISLDNGANRCGYYTCEWQIELPVNTSLDTQPVVSPDPTPTTRWVSLPWTKTHVSNTGLDTTMTIPDAALFVPPNMDTVKFRSTARISTVGASETQTYTVTSNTLPNVEIGSPRYTLNEAITFEEGNPVSIKVTPTRNTTPVDFAYYTVQDQQGDEWITIYISQWVAQDDGTFQGNGYYSSSNTESLPVGSICWCVWTKEYYDSLTTSISNVDNEINTVNSEINTLTPKVDDSFINATKIGDSTLRLTRNNGTSVDISFPKGVSVRTVNLGSWQNITANTNEIVLITGSFSSSQLNNYTLTLSGLGYLELEYKLFTGSQRETTISEITGPDYYTNLSGTVSVTGLLYNGASLIRTR